MNKYVFSFVLLNTCFLTHKTVGAEELLSYKGISASTNGDYKCQADVDVRLDAPQEDSYRRSRVDMQALSDMVKTYLWLDCDELESINFTGYAEGQNTSVYQASASKENNWYHSLKNEDEKSTPLLSKKNKDKNKPKSSTNKTLSQNENWKTQESLEQASATGQQEATKELAKGLLGLESRNKSISFKQDKARGIQLLESLASNGNSDAKHLLAEAYRKFPKEPLNQSLLDKITKSSVSVNRTRTEITTSMTMEAAREGSEEAIKALNNAGNAGSSHSHYALGSMYLLDQSKQMPLEKSFLESLLGGVKGKKKKGKGNKGKRRSRLQVGLHFMKLAAEKGNSRAQKILEDMDVKFASSQSSKKNKSPEYKNNQLQNHAAVQLAEAVENLKESGLSSVVNQSSSSSGSASKMASSGQGSAKSQGKGKGKRQSVGKGNDKAAQTKKMATNQNVPRGNEIEGNQITEEKEEEIID